MQPALAPVPPTPPADDLGVEPLLRGAWELVRAHPLPLLLPLVLLGLLGSGGSGPLGPEARFDASDAFDDPLVFLPFLAAFGLLALAVVIVVFFLYVVAYLVTTRAALDAIETVRAPDLAVAFRATQHRIMGAAGTSLLFVLVVLVGFLLLIVPGIIALAALMPLMAVIVSEGRTGTDALKRAWELTKGHKGPLAVLVILSLVANLLVGAVLGWLPLVGGALAGAVGGAISALLATAGALFYARRMNRLAPPPSPLAVSTIDTPP